MVELPVLSVACVAVVVYCVLATRLIPVFRMRGKRWRIRFRAISWKTPKLMTDVYPEGTVHRLFVGFILVVAMVDEGS